MRDALSRKIVDIEPSGIRKFFDIVSEMPDAISLGVGEPDFDTPYRVREEGIYSLEKGRTFYTSNAGLKELRDEISRYIARKYNMVSNLGKILDPIADKLSQIAIVIILLVKFWDGPLKYILFLFIFKELLMIIGAAILMSKGMRPVAAEIWGKLATVVFYTFMITIIAIGPDGALLSIDLFKGLELNNTVIMIMVIISAILAFASLFGYAPGFIRQLKENKEKSDSSEK